MDLRTYLFNRRMKISEFARKIDFSAVHLYRIVHGPIIPSKKLARIIERETGGQVTVEELRGK